MTTTVPTPHLDGLIGAVDAAQDSPLDRLASAVAVAERLGEVADALVGHYVERARRSGASWAEIGGSLGTSKQAAQKRFVARVQPGAALDASAGFSLFTDEARAVVLGAQDQARAAGSDAITVAHLVLALVADPTGVTARALTAQHVCVKEVRRIATACLPGPSGTVPDLIPFDAHCRAVLARTFAEAQRLGSDVVDCGHLLLAVLAVEDGTGVLAGLGVTPAATEALLSGSLGADA